MIKSYWNLIYPGSDSLERVSREPREWEQVTEDPVVEEPDNIGSR